jgi:hypothetical protein
VILLGRLNPTPAAWARSSGRVGAVSTAINEKKKADDETVTRQTGKSSAILEGGKVADMVTWVAA